MVIPTCCECGKPSKECEATVQHSDKRFSWVCPFCWNAYDYQHFLRGETVKYHVTKEGCWKLGGKLRVFLPPGSPRRLSPAFAIYESIHGPQREGINLVARCGDPDCFNPEHMEENATQTTTGSMRPERTL